MAGNRKGKYDIAPMIRHAFAKGVGITARNKGITVPELFAEWIEKDPVAVMNAAAKFAVKEKQVSGKVDHDHKHEHNHKHTAVREVDARIAELIGSGKERDVPETLPH